MRNITCQICNQIFNGQISGLHLKNHGTDTKTYQLKYGPTRHPETLAAMIKGGSKGGGNLNAAQAKRDAKTTREKAYQANPKQCLYCKVPLSYQDKKQNKKFCNRSCSAKFNNRNKKTGTRRSRLECFIYDKIKDLYPNITIKNNTKIEGLEFDLYLPDIALAVEINGYVHYKPIWGQEKLERIQALDVKKQGICKQLGIDLLVIDSSNQLRFNEKSSSGYLSQIVASIQQKLSAYTTLTIKS